MSLLSSASYFYRFYPAPLMVAVVTSFLVVETVSAGHVNTEEMLVVDSRQRRNIDMAETVEITPDAAALLRKAPGANVNGNGPLTGIPQYRGMYGPRINVEVNGTRLSSGGPNWMDPPLSYAPAAQLESLEVYRGIAPVSVGQETIGGAINAKTWSGDFGDTEDFSSSGRIRFGGQSVNQASLLSGVVVVANRHHRVKVSALTEQAADAEFADGDIEPSEYERQRYDLGYGYQHNGHSIQFDVGRNETNDSGTPALPMDIAYIDSDLGSVRYQLTGEDWSVDATLYYSDIEHGMSNFHLRQPPSMMARWRRNTATGDNLGFSIKTHYQGSHGRWSMGVDGHQEEHNSDIDNPNNPQFFVVNFNNARRQIVGLFVERQQNFGQGWTSEFGLRFNQVDMDADEVDGTPAMMSMMGVSPAGQLRDQFNAADRKHSDNNIDWVAKVFYQASKTSHYYMGLARKTRSASYQERFLWLPLEATGGLADGRTYTGNLELDPEVAHEIELGLDYSHHGLSFSPRVYYRQVDDFIQGTQSSNMNALMFVTMMNTMSGSNNAMPLQFNNVEAEFYGFDMDWSYQLDDQWSLSGVVNYVRGKRDDISDDLYRIAPPNTSLAVHYQAHSWGLTAETVLYAEQDNVSETNSELQTAGYGLVNIKGDWQLSNKLRLGFGVDNVLDRHYLDHLAGYNRATNEDIAKGARLPGFGRNVFARFDYQW